MIASPRPITLLIAALGGEGGSVLTHWIISAAEQAGYPVQSTSIPGVAQRTGATTYYIEILPVLTGELDGKRPVLALTPGVGDIDIAVASELLEAGRTVANGFVTPDRTSFIASPNVVAPAPSTAVRWATNVSRWWVPARGGIVSTPRP
jgi:indolepyruvate ferredoxin oxidoreductase beta subunit